MIQWNHPTVVILLQPFSLLYGLVMSVRNALYDRNILRSFKIPATVVSVGNITVGGTGKTPLVELLARFFLDEGFRPAVVSRGYGRTGKRIVVVSDGKKVLSNPDRTGDEPLMLGRHLEGIPILVGADRVKAATKAVRTFESDLILLDDGFQHRRLKRDVDVVALKRSHPFGNEKVLPAGPLREPRKGLGRAQVVVLTGRKSSDERDAGFRGDISEKSNVLEAVYRPIEWVQLSNGQMHPLSFLQHRFVFVFSGIGNPGSFETTLEEMDLKMVGHWIFRDHYRYASDDLKRIADRAESHGAVSVVTTEKDAVRITDQWKGKLPLYYLRIKMEIEGGGKKLQKVFRPLIK
jgi:tetraacyldisaccharide 4'-kinase